MVGGATVSDGFIECKMCGNCCHNPPLMEEWEVPNVKSELERKGIQVRWEKVGSYHTFETIESWCPVYSPEEGCLLHGRYKPAKCEALVCAKCLESGSEHEASELTNLRRIELGLTT